MVAPPVTPSERATPPTERTHMPRLASTLALLVLAGCVSVGKTVLVPGLPPKAEADVQVFLPGDSVPPHERVAILEADFNDSMSDGSDVLNKLRQEAAKLGADGIVLVGTEAESDAARVMRTLATGAYLGGRAKTQALAILVQD